MQDTTPCQNRRTNIQRSDPMKHLSRIALAALALGSLTLGLQAQDDARPRRGGGMVPPLVKALDTTKDGSLDAAEIAAASNALLTLDTDKDGALSREELRPQPPAGAPSDRPERPSGDAEHGPRGDRQGGGRPGGHPIIGALDADHDGVLSPSEIANASAALATLDSNSDGKITMDELRPARPEGEGRAPRGPRGDRN